MSASLVGSEMCIRDSSWAARPRTCSRITACAILPHRAYNRKVLHMQSPVSYTHLTLPTICSV
eukprot:7817097-Alexandrium_andersonii.AAC.1